MSYPITRETDLSLEEVDEIRKISYRRGYEEGHADAISLQSSFSKVMGEKICSLRNDIIRLQAESYRYRSELQKCEENKPDATVKEKK